MKMIRTICHWHNVLHLYRGGAIGFLVQNFHGVVLNVTISERVISVCNKIKRTIAKPRREDSSGIVGGYVQQKDYL